MGASAQWAPARDMLTLAVQRVWSTALQPRPKEVILGIFSTTSAVTTPDRRRAKARLVGFSNLQQLDICIHGGGCYVTVHAAAVQCFIRSVRRDVFDDKADVAKVDKVTVLSDFDKFSPSALSAQEQKSCATPEEVTRLAGWEQLRRPSSLGKCSMPRRTPPASETVQFPPHTLGSAFALVTTNYESSESQKQNGDYTNAVTEMDPTAPANVESSIPTS